MGIRPLRHDHPHDSQSITKSPILFRQGTGIASGEQFLARNLNYFDAIFFFGVREIDLDAEQRADLLRFVHDDGKGVVATHAGATAFFSWPDYQLKDFSRTNVHVLARLDLPSSI